MKTNIDLGIPTDFKLEDWFPMSPLEGPPLPKWLGLTWPWYKEERPAPVVPWAYSDVQASIDGQAGVSIWYWVDFSARISNIGNQAATKTVTLFYRVRYGSNPFSSEYVFKSELLTLSPGESYIFTGWRVPAPGYPEEALTITGGYTYELWLVDSDGKESSRVQVAM